ncbi:unnamed protein product [Durusdinium trenchii]|uniref:FYVE-type domain-containing protein n=1 Tax=Durusdinium trenchii TaxID=1381693 RepID=A0ABP0K289_9DINO
MNYAVHPPTSSTLLAPMGPPSNGKRPTTTTGHGQMGRVSRWSPELRDLLQQCVAYQGAPGGVRLGLYGDHHGFGLWEAAVSLAFHQGDDQAATAQRGAVGDRTLRHWFLRTPDLGCPEGEKRAAANVMSSDNVASELRSVTDACELSGQHVRNKKRKKVDGSKAGWWFSVRVEELRPGSFQDLRCGAATVTAFLSRPAVVPLSMPGRGPGGEWSGAVEQARSTNGLALGLRRPAGGLKDEGRANEESTGSRGTAAGGPREVVCGHHGPVKWLLTWDAAFNVVFGPAPLAVEVTEAFVLPKFLPAIANTTWAVTRHACDLTYFVSEMVTDVWDAPVVAFFVFRDGKLSPVGGVEWDGAQLTWGPASWSPATLKVGDVVGVLVTLQGELQGPSLGIMNLELFCPMVDPLKRNHELDWIDGTGSNSKKMPTKIVGDWLRFGASTATQRLSQLGQKVGQAFNETAMRRCVACGESYIRAGMWTCAECTQLGCRNCLSVTNLHGPAAPRPAQQILCKGCQPLVKKRCAEGNARLRLQRIDAFLGSHLEPYTYDPESKLEQTLRLSGYAMQGLKKVSGFIPWAQAAQAIEAGYYLVRYGPLILAGNEIMESFQLILGLAKKLELPSYHRLASPDFFGGLYYSMGEHWGMRGRVPDMEMAQHAADGEVPVPDHGLLLTLRHLTRLLLVSKESTPTDAQRLLRQAMPGAELVLAEFSGSPTVPSFFLVCAHQARVAYLVMPGTRNLSDLVTDFNAAEEPFGTGQGHRGMIQSARWMEEQVGPALIRLYTSGFRITILGHSLGAGVGAFLTLILRPQISNLYCYGFGTPACVDEQLMPSLLNCMVSVVNRDDLVPRLSVKSVQGLLESVLCPGQVAKTQAWMKEDWQAVKDLERVVELRRRGQVPAEAQELGDGEEATERLLVPGQVIHLYRHNGLARAARCAAGHEVLTRIIPSQEMLHDHKMESYARALHQACRLDVTVPAWESFDQRELCACCDSDFTWAYVLQSEPQKMLARHHCFACGRVVCEGCSRKRLAHERLGFQLPVRTCDRCAFLQFEDADDALRAFANEEEAAKNSAAM